MNLPGDEPIWTDADRDLLADTACRWGVPLDAGALDRFEQYAYLLAHTNRVMNLTRVPVRETVSRHFLDSLSIATAVRLQPAMSVIDVGSGAGLPGLPIAIAFPQVRVTLLDGTQKRVRFLAEVAQQLSLSNVNPIAGRAEELSQQSDYAAAFDMVVARAVAPMHGLIGWLAPFAKPGGTLVAYKSSDIAEEMRLAADAMAQHGIRLAQSVAMEVPGIPTTRTLVVLTRAASPQPTKSDPRHRAQGRKSNRTER